MAIHACVSSIIPSDFKNIFFKKTAPRFSDAHRTYSGDLIQCNQATGHKCLRGGPWCFFFNRHSTKYLTLTQNFYCGPQILLATPVRLLIRSNEPCAPRKFHATVSTTSSVISTGLKTGVASYTSNATPRGFYRADFPCQCFCNSFIRNGRFVIRPFVR